MILKDLGDPTIGNLEDPPIFSAAMPVFAVKMFCKTGSQPGMALTCFNLAS